MEKKYEIIVFRDASIFDAKLMGSEFFINPTDENEQAIIKKLKDINAELEFDYPVVYVSFKCQEVAEQFIEDVLDPLLLAEEMTRL